MHDTLPSRTVSGRVRGYLVTPKIDRSPFWLKLCKLAGRDPAKLERWEPQGAFESNQVMYDWATIVGELLRGAPDGKPYKIGGLYLEYENNGGAPVSPPTFERDGGIDYYTNLSGSATRDYLRVPLTVVDLESSNTSNFPGGNALTFFGRTDGVVGVHGKTFSNAVSSRVYGGALVAYPDFGDATQDLVFSRFYWADTANQIIKATGSQIGLEWSIQLM